MRLRKVMSSLALSAVTLAFALTPARTLAGEYRIFFYHVHTIHSTDNPEFEIFKPSVAEVIERADRVAAEMGMEAGVAITDHRTIDAYFDPEFAPVGLARPMKGEEWGGSGHAGALNFAGDSPITEYSGPDRYVQLVEETHSKGGIVIANHPEPGDWETDRRLGIDGIEVWSVTFWDPTDELALEWWQRLLAAGEQVTAVGGSDSHFRFLPIETPSNLVWCESNHPDDMAEGVRDGRLIILAAPGSPRVFLTADVDGDGLYDDAMVGDVITIAGTTTVDFQARVEGAGPTDQLLLADRGGLFFSCEVGSGTGWEGSDYRFSHAFSPTERNFVRAELRNGSDYPHCLGNPIYAVGALAPVETEGEILGTVWDASTGAPLEGVSVEATPGEFSIDTTGSDGTYSIVLPVGTYKVKAMLSGYLPRTHAGVVVEGGEVVLDFELSLSSCGAVPAGRESRGGGLARGLGFIFPVGLVLAYLRCRKRTH